MEGPQDAVDVMVSAFDERRRLIVKGLNDLAGVQCCTPAGAFYAFPNITATGFSAGNFQDRLLEEAGVAAVAGTSFGAMGEGFIRFSYANSIENIERALHRVEDFLGLN